MSGKCPLFSHRQTQALNSLLSGASIHQAAQDAHVCEKTVSRWLGQPVFMDALKASESKVLDSVSIRLMGLAGKALDVLSRILDGDTSPGSNVRRLAAANVLELVGKWLEWKDFDERLSRLEVQSVKQHRRTY